MDWAIEDISHPDPSQKETHCCVCFLFTKNRVTVKRKTLPVATKVFASQTMLEKTGNANAVLDTRGYHVVRSLSELGKKDFYKEVYDI